ncbi:hypothetical protein K435DRAFT_968828 [Dendrothele bispora CBS 962.96]|uniref:Uncharacterized protein n=1 Tax=Dendrothele bispora (strain CBS 962.96) TaxID=1314807 RepID=A0A4S8LLD4_DENBC|nr:hypothetical protein K435DRAFT_968828 [Dendrothele bispora CBS 962.96]
MSEPVWVPCFNPNCQNTIPARLRCRGRNIPEHTGLWWLHLDKHAQARSRFQARQTTGDPPPPPSPQFSDSGPYCPGIDQLNVNSEFLFGDPPSLTQSLYAGPPPPQSLHSRSSKQSCSTSGCRKTSNAKCERKSCKGHCLNAGGCATVPDHRRPGDFSHFPGPPPSSQLPLSSSLLPSTAALVASWAPEASSVSQPLPSTSTPVLHVSGPPPASQPITHVRVPLSAPSTNAAPTIPIPSSTARGRQYYTAVVDRKGVNVEAECEARCVEKAKADVTLKLATSAIAIFCWTSKMKPTPLEVQGLVVDGYLQITRMILDRVGIAGDIFCFYRFGMRSWMSVEVDYVAKIKDALRLDGIPVLLLKASSVEECDGIDELLCPSVPLDLLTKPFSISERRSHFKEYSEAREVICSRSRPPPSHPPPSSRPPPSSHRPQRFLSQPPPLSKPREHRSLSQPPKRLRGTTPPSDTETSLKCSRKTSPCQVRVKTERVKTEPESPKTLRPVPEEIIEISTFL